MIHRFTSFKSLFIVALAAVALTAAACGGDDDDGGGGGGATSPPAASGPGTITLSSTPITGQSGKILLAFATTSSGGERLGRICAPITSDDFTLSGGVMTEVPSGNDPCGEDTPDATFDEGTYNVTAGIYVGGEQTPEAETTLTVEVAGETTAELDGSALSP